MYVIFDLAFVILLFLLNMYCLLKLTPKLLSDYLLLSDPINHQEIRLESLKIWSIFFTAISIWIYFYITPRSTAVVFATVLPFLFSLGYIDFKTHFLPDKLQLICLLFALTQFGIDTYSSYNSTDIFTSRIFALTVPFSVWAIGKLYEKFRGINGLGFGDIKLLGWMAVYIDIDVFSILLISILFALIFNLPRVLTKKIDSQTPFAFGPFILIAFACIAFLKYTYHISIFSLN